MALALPTRSTGRDVLALALSVLLVVGIFIFGPVQPAAAAPGDFQCGQNTIYGTLNNTLYRINAGTGASTTVGTFAANVNALGIAKDGDGAYAIAPQSSSTSYLYRYGTATPFKTLTGLAGNSVPAGAFNPLTGDYWFAVVTNPTTNSRRWNFYKVDVSSAATTVNYTSPTMTYTASTGNASVGTDFLFDARGYLYLVISTDNTTYTNQVLTFTATQVAAGGSPTPAHMVNLDAGNATITFPGVAFGSSGHIYTQGGSSLYRSNPTNGDQVGSPASTSQAFTDLGSCANPTIIDTVRKNVIDRRNASDRFNLSLSGPGFTTPKTVTAATPATGIQNEQVSATVVLPATTYNIAETAANGANLANYVTTWQCVNTSTDAVIASGNGSTGQFTTPDTLATGNGAPVTCTFTNAVKNPAIEIVKNSSSTPTSAGDTITYSFTVTNTGNRPLTGVTVTDPKLSGLACAANSLEAGASTTCSAAPYTVTQADVEAGRVDNTATVTASPPSGEGAAGSVTDTDTKRVDIPRTPRLRITKVGSGNPFRAGDTITYSFTVTNTGNVQVTGVGIDDPKLTGETCTPTTLAPGATANCTANPYTVTAADVAAGSVDNTASPIGTSVAGAATMDPASDPSETVNIGTLPVADPDTRTTLQNVNVSVNPLGNDHAGVSGAGVAGTLNPTSVVFTGAGASPDGKSLTVPGQGAYSIDPATGVVTFDPEPGFTGEASAVPYRVTDSHGLTASSTITITVTPIVPVARDNSATTGYLVPVDLAVLANDNAGDSSAPLVAASVVFTAAGASPDGKSLTTVQGTYTINSAGVVHFVPAAGFTGTTSPVQYRVLDANGTPATANVTIAVAAPPAPSASPDAETTLQNQDVDVNPLVNDTASGGAVLNPASVVFTAGTATDGGKRLVVPGEGTYTINPTTGVVTFDPLPGFSGDATPVEYRVADNLGQTATSTISITVTPVQPVANDDSATTPYLTPVGLSPLGNDWADPSAVLVPGSVGFTSDDATDGGKTLVTAQGTWTINPDGTAAFAPASGFSGQTDAVEYRVADANGTATTANLRVTVGAPPAANPNLGTTPQNVNITLDPLANDAAGSDGAGGAGVLAPGSVVFTSVAATDGGKRLAVTGQGVYTVAGDGRVTFDPEPGFTGTADAVGYRVTDSFGNSATSTITITVTPISPMAADDANHTPFGHPVTTTVLANDAAGALTAPLDASSVVFVANGAKTLTNADGTYTVNPDGTVTFAPAPGTTGLLNSVAYRVADANGTTTTANLVLTVGTPPVAGDDTTSTPQDVNVSLNPLSNDVAGNSGDGIPGTLVPGSVVFTSTDATDAGRTLVVPGEGSYTIDPVTGAVTFDPEPGFTGAATPVGYAVTDSFGNTAEAVIRITVSPIIPSAADDAEHTPYRTPVTANVLGNDSAGAASAPLDTASVVITTPGATDAGLTLVVPGQGTWTVNSDGTITFAPQDGFSGPADLIDYAVSDSNGTTAGASLLVTVGFPPVANPDLDSTPQNVDVTLNPLANDVAGDDGEGNLGTFDGTSVVFTSAAATGGGKTLVVPGEGSYTIDPVTGAVTFDPEPGFTGETTPVDYAVTDNHGNTAASTITITVAGIIPSADDDAEHTPYRTPVTADVLGNDSAGAASAPLDPASVVITTPGATDAGLTLVVPGQGTWTVNSDGTITFAPADGFTGPATIAYQVFDVNGTPATANLTVTVGNPPSAADDSANTLQNVDVTLDPLGNDAAGDDGDGTVGTLDATSVVFTSADATDGGRTLVVPGEGSYTIDPVTGEVTFDPEPGFTGATTPVAYAVTDSFGHTTAALIRITVDPITPSADDDINHTPHRTPVTTDVLDNDSAGAASAPLDAASVVIITPGATDAGLTLVVPGQGTWTVQPDGDITFAPAAGFTGPATINYQVVDANGTAVSANLTVTVGNPPAAGNDLGTTPQNVNVTVDPLTNDTAGDDGDGNLGTLDGASVVFTSAAATDAGKTLVVPGEGTYTVDPVTGLVTFDPEPGFTGPATAVDYEVTDSHGNTAAATVRITVTPISPSAVSDAATTDYRTAVTVGVLANDTPGAASAPLVPASVVFTSADATDAGLTLVVPGEGTYRVNPDGTITFTPATGFRGDTTAVTYQVSDANGTPATANLTITVSSPPAPVAADDSNHTPHNTAVTSWVLGNDNAGGLATLQPASVRLTDPLAINDGSTLVVPGEGTYQVNPDGSVRFTPEPGFTGPATGVGYEVADEFGQTATATLTVTVGEPPAATDDSASTPQNVDVTVEPLGNDTAGDNGEGVSGALVPSTVVFTSASATDGGKTLVVAGEGTYTVNPVSGAITFDPEPEFTGAATPVAYEVRDSFGNPATAYVRINVTPIVPIATDDTDHTPYGTPVTTDLVGNDVAGSATAPLNPASVVLTSLAATDGGKRLDTADGSYRVNADGSVTFTPAAGFSGPATPVGYLVGDANGTTATAFLTVTVGAPPAASNDSTITGHDTVVTLNPLGNDTAGDDGAGTPGSLDATSVVFTSAEAADGGRTLVVAGEGAYSIDPVTGVVTFDPEPGFTGATSGVEYAVTDGHGNTATAVITITVGQPPRAGDDSASTPQNVNVTLNPLGNDTAGDDGAGSPGSLDATSVVFTSAEAADGGRTLVVAGEGAYSIDPVTGVVTFDPEPGFSGAATGVRYAVTDSYGNTAEAVIRITVTGIEPTAVDDTATTPAATPVTVAVLGNDTHGASSAPLVPSSVVFTSDDATDAGLTLVVADEGTWTINADGTITFTPEPGFTGPATPVEYLVRDANGTPATASVRVIVGTLPNAADDSANTPQNVNVTLDPLGNDTPGDDGAGGPGSLDAASVVFTSAAATDGGKTLVVPGEGAYGIDPVTGAVTFDPEPGFTGLTTGVDYAVTDSFGNTAEATITVRVSAINPAATDDTNQTPFGTPVTTPVLANDSAGAASAPLDPSSVVFTSPEAADEGKTLVVDGEGTWTVNSDGTITFTPEPGFSGPAAPVEYRVRDTNGTPVTASLTVTVGEPPAAVPDYAATPQNIDVTLDPLGNDRPGDDGTGAPGTLVATSVMFTSADATDAGKRLVVPGEGVYTIGGDGRVTFDPEPGFTGTATGVEYSVTDSFGNTATATIHITVTGIIPAAVDDAAVTPANTPVTVPVLANDTAGAPSAPLDPGSVVFTSPDATDAGLTLVVAGEGVWTVNPDGSIAFTPEDGFTGPATPVQYLVRDTNGTPVAATVQVTVGSPPAATDDSATTPQNVNVTVCPPCNDTPGDDGAGNPGTFDPASVVFTSPDATDGGKTLVVDGEGTYVIDPATGAVTFDPETGFTGATTPVGYAVTDSFGNTTEAAIAITVTPVVPEAAADSATGPFDTPVTVPVLDNDLPGHDSAPLVPASVVLTSPEATDEGKTLIVDGEGTWTVNPDGSITFTPEDGFTGPATPVEYRVSDTNGESATSTVTVTIGTGPSASADQVRGTEPGQPVVIDVLANDVAGSGCVLMPESLVLLEGGPDSPTAVTILEVPGEGYWIADSDGTLTFTPVDDFSGWTSWVDYRVTDGCGNTVTAQARAFVPAGDTAIDDETDESDAGGGSLAHTGAEVAGLLGLALALLVGGGLLLGWRRRRQA